MQVFETMQLGDQGAPVHPLPDGLQHRGECLGRQCPASILRECLRLHPRQIGDGQHQIGGEHGRAIPAVPMPGEQAAELGEAGPMEVPAWSPVVTFDHQGQVRKVGFAPGAPQQVAAPEPKAHQAGQYKQQARERQRMLGLVAAYHLDRQ